MVSNEVFKSLRDLCAVGLLDETLKEMDLMHQRGMPIYRDIIYLSLQVCTKKKDLAAGKRVHALMITDGLDSVAVLGDHLIRLFAVCGSLIEANIVFCKVAQPSVFTWHAALSANAMLEEDERALQLYYEMQKQMIKPGKFTFSRILKSCASIRALQQGRLVHDQIIKSALTSDVVVGSSLIDMYGKCGSLEEAQKVFDGLQKRNEVSWNSMLAGFVQLRHGLLALQLFERMQGEGIYPGKVTFLCLLKACSSMKAISWGQQIHNLIIRSGLEMDAAIGSALVDTYAKCGSMEAAREVFDKLRNRNGVTWGAMISGYAEHGHGNLAVEVFGKMIQEGFKPNQVLFSCVMKGCSSIKAIELGRLVHDQITRSGVKLDEILGSSLVDMYAKCGSLEEALKVFNGLPIRNVVTWSAMIAGHSQHGNGHAALELFNKMQQLAIKSDRVTFICVLKACGNLGVLIQGKLIHRQVITYGLDSDVVVGSTLIDMYAKCGSLADALKVFDRLSNCNAISWAAIISGYAQHGFGYSALEFFKRMNMEGIKPGRVALLFTLKACGSLGALLQGKLIHEQVIGSSFKSDVVLGNVLIDMYAKCGALEGAHKVFDEMPTKDLVSWGTMIAGFSQYGEGANALRVFGKMQEEGVKPDGAIFSCILDACCSMGAIGQGKFIHDQILRSGFGLDVVIGNTLVNLYVQSGRLDEAEKVFYEFSNQNMVSWNALIAGYAKHGAYGPAGQFFDYIQQQGLKPFDTAYTSILSACSHAGRVEEGQRYFRSMLEDHGITPLIQHFNCIVDILGRSGHLMEAEELLESMPIPPNEFSWTSLLTACRMHRNVELGRKCFEQLVFLECNGTSGYVLMSNLSADAHLWEDVFKLEGMRWQFGEWKRPGRAWLEAAYKGHEFVAGDSTHPQFDKIDAKFKRLINSIKDEGYLPLLDLLHLTKP